ncbi:MAG: hypothetical protein WC380_09210 [Pedobacter sp.]|jgi:hypothetical protein
MDYDKELIDYYREQKIYRKNPLRLDYYCTNAKLDAKDNCWYLKSRKLNPFKGYQRVTRPYVGKHYKTSRVLILGMNHRDNFDQKIFDEPSESQTESQNLVEDLRDPNKYKYYSEYCSLWYASKCIKDRINKGEMGLCNSAYGKTYAFMFTYAVILVGMVCNFQEIKGDIETSKEQSIITDYIAWTQTVKCNPKEVRKQNPTVSMWKNCPCYVLQGELEILKPKYILVLGLTDNFPSILRLLRKMNFKQDSNQGHYKSRKPPNIKYWVGYKGRSRIHLIGVPHPGTPRGYKQEEISKKLRSLLQSIA